jgi:hypothetical protein
VWLAKAQGARAREEKFKVQTQSRPTFASEAFLLI